MPNWKLFNRILQIGFCVQVVLFVVGLHWTAVLITLPTVGTATIVSRASA